MPTVVMIGGSLLAGLYWFTQRRQQVMAVEAAESAEKEAKNVLRFRDKERS